jgi:hypothetical protein
MKNLFKKLSFHHLVFSDFIAFTILLPLFFSLHQWNEYFKLIIFSDFLYGIFILSLILMSFFFCLSFFYSSKIKAAVLSNSIFAFFLFYPYKSITECGIYQLKIIIFILTLLLAVFFLLFINNLSAHKTILFKKYLIILLLSLVSYEGIIFFFKSISDEPIALSSSAVEIKSLHKLEEAPSVYVIVLDEYAGQESLKKNGKFDNNLFNDDLKNLGFKIINNSKSNYNYTIFSIASLLNLDYNKFNFPIYDERNYKTALYRISNNRTIQYFDKLGYRIINLSPFKMYDYERFYRSFVLPMGTELIFSPTMFDDIVELAPLFITRRLPNKTNFEKLIEKKTSFNKSVLDNMIEESEKKSDSPLFCFAHVNMPHAIYARDSFGRVNTSFLTKKPITNKDKKDAYIQYLVYVNKFITPYLSQLIKINKDNSIIILMSDHGSRDLARDNNNSDSEFSNLIAVYHSEGEKRRWYDKMSNVNIFRIILSEITNQNLPLLKDSIVNK